MHEMFTLHTIHVTLNNCYTALQTIKTEKTFKEEISFTKTKVHLPAIHILYNFCLKMAFYIETFSNL
jgi:hypothetical protein